jgi:Bacterial Ig-like domain (group 2)
MHPSFTRHMLTATAIVLIAACDRPDVTSLAPTTVAEADRRAPSVELSRVGGRRLVVGDTVTLRVSNAISRARVVRWSSSDSRIAAVSGTGVVRALRKGSAKVTVASSAGSDTTQVTVVNEDEAVVVVEISAPAASLAVGARVRLSAEGRDFRGDAVFGRPVSWSRVAGTAATISAAGELTAVSTGAVTIRAAMDGVSCERTFTITAPVQDAPAPTLIGLEITPDNDIRLAPRAVEQFDVQAIWSNGTRSEPAVTWSTSRGTISSDGRYTAPGTTGTFLVVARMAAEPLADTVTVVVAFEAPTVTAFAIAPKTGAALAPGATRQFSRSVSWSDGATRAVGVTYTATGGTISSNGLFTAGQVAGAFMVIANCACGRADTAAVQITQVAAQLASLTISPSTATMQTGTSRTFTTTALWSTGATTLPPITYSATGGTVTAQGVYTAPNTAGTYRVIVAHTGGTVRDTSVVTVTAPPATPATLSSLTIAPATVSVSVGATLQFAASGTWSNGATTAPAVSYSTTGGSITTSGLFTAPTTAGTYRVIVAHTGGTLRDTSVVTVTGQVTTPPPAGGSNEPSGMSVLIDRPFSARGEGGWSDNNSSDLTFVADPTAPFSPGMVGQQRYRPGFTAGNAPAVTGKVFPSAKGTVYVSYWVKLSSNWVGHGSAVNKQLYIWSNGQPTVYVNARGSGSGTLVPEVRIQGGGLNLTMGPNVRPTATFSRGEWHKWELVLTTNSAGVSDGKCDFWLDGVKVGSYTGIRYHAGAANFTTVEWVPIWGGVGGSLSVEQFNWMDHLYISGK